jgi:hypothetical protein
MGDDPAACHEPQEIAPLWADDALGRRVRLCEIVAPADLGPWLDALSDAGPLAARVRVVDHRFGWSVEREAAGCLSISLEDASRRFDVGTLRDSCGDRVQRWVRSLRFAATRTLSADERAWLGRAFPEAEVDLGRLAG